MTNNGQALRTHNGETMRPFLLRLLEQPGSPYAQQFDARTMNDGQVARCRACQMDVYPRERAEGPVVGSNRPIERWETELQQHQATCPSKAS
ncbi:MAG TPA: hypothetical protein VGQ62_17760 [Chloroflexota bacterium]|jgi:hypothetical protein|nr:hypothetical protein [Chloroflexota bacterium]